MKFRSTIENCSHITAFSVLVIFKKRGSFLAQEEKRYASYLNRYNLYPIGYECYAFGLRKQVNWEP